ncbi:UDP-glucose 4-epimerase family protein [Shewanella sp. 10N.286.48.B5]|uniref:UDP-glucose 4-epimerase family protein n=1 Tax=Shewanella sp. 10N.286.48.B5 TaxID=1880834 RepID=UPI000C85BDC5|nr:SDR family oxidoreductase [Shewanella sp. 10N.286.48.B5]PMH87606.1 UDP-glucose 4-epimerase [Shewanella sp. 10N.286.48.B5]
MYKVLLTGYTGFVGSNVLDLFKERADSIKCLGRRKPQFGTFYQGELSSSSEYGDALDGVDVIIHCAARVHVMDDSSIDPLGEFREVNTFATLNLAKQAIAAGVKRFIFVSSIKVNGESTLCSMPFTAANARSPEDFYGKSKSEAEEQLLQLAKDTGLEVVIIRPTLVYGPGVKANFASLMNLVSKGLPLPFGSIIHNKRSLVSVKNLVDLIMTCVDHPKAANQVFLVSDDHDVSTASMVKHMSYALGKSSRLIPVPLWCYRLVGKLIGKSDVVDRLIGSLQVDISHTKDTLGWVPPQTLEQGFKETAEYFLLNKNK